MNVIFTCGGTAGHINPAIALAQRIAKENPEAEFLFADALEFGRGTPANQKKAFEFYSRAAKYFYA
jgi:UDP-N-acetylglucosamine:LPS N-acetylglucosamine transferase